MSPGAPSEITSSGGRSPRSFMSARNAAQASVDSEAPGARCNSTGLPVVVIPQATSTGSAFAPAWYLKWDPVEEQVLELDVGQGAVVTS